MTADAIRAIDIAPCGIDCALCYARQRAKKTCPGCNGDDANKPASCVSCVIRQCDSRADGRSLSRGSVETRDADAATGRFCDSCVSYPCKRMKALRKRYGEKYGADLRSNLAAIRERGMRAFIAEEKRAWACASCGSLLCMHKAECPACGAPNPRFGPIT